MATPQQNQSLASSAVLMDTLVSIEVFGAPSEAQPAVDRAFGWFVEVERRVSRFEPDSEVAELCRRPGEPVKVSAVLFQALAFALRVAEATDGAFDPAVGGRLAAAGFDRSYKTGLPARLAADPAATYRHILLDRGAGTVTLQRPLVIDLGAVAKGFAMDLAAKELMGFDAFCIDAGGDILVKGPSPTGGPWAIGLQHPRRDDEVIDVLYVTDAAVCTSGDYERRGPNGEPHITVSGHDANVISATVVAPTATAADALSTAAFALGPEQGLRLLAREGVEGFIVTQGLRRHETAGLARLRR